MFGLKEYRFRILFFNWYLVKFKNNLKKQKSELHNEKKKCVDNTQIEFLKRNLVSISKQQDDIKKKIISLKKNKLKLFMKEKLLIQEEKCIINSFLENSEHWAILNSKYLPLQLIGKGGFSEVFLCFNLNKLTNCVCKLHLPASSFSSNNNYPHSNLQLNLMKYTLREIKVLKKLDHPHIIKFFESFQLPDQQIFVSVLEFCEGEDLDVLLKSRGKLSEKYTLKILKQILSALLYLDQQKPKIIHFDIKPKNILFDYFGNVKITDFGLCKELDYSVNSKITLTSQGAGTYWYLPPETFMSPSKAKISNKVDIWALGVVTFEMLYGKKPFENEMFQDSVVNHHMVQNNYKLVFPPKPKVSLKTQNFIKGCLQIDQKIRFNVNEAINFLFGSI